MDFNIKDFLIKKNQKYKTPEDDIINVLKKYIPYIQKKDIDFIQGKIYIKNISPTKKTHIKLHKKKILNQFSQSEFNVHDII